jgi:hypothetical protein
MAAVGRRQLAEGENLVTDTVHKLTNRERSVVHIFGHGVVLVLVLVMMLPVLVLAVLKVVSRYCLRYRMRVAAVVLVP